ncbi:MAG TPA: hypothetical protein VKC57_04480, partial [Ktedonobacterales bacterium]|nr:hypothetical protein [Ktedonobacterales bacterium]
MSKSKTTSRVGTERVAPAPVSPELARHVDRLLSGEHHNPHEVLGVHPVDSATLVRVFHPAATDATVVWSGGEQNMERVDERGLFEARLAGVTEPPAYRLRMRTGLHKWEMDDPYRFLPTLGELDVYLIGEGQHMELWRRLGARVIEHQGVRGTAF